MPQDPGPRQDTPATAGATAQPPAALLSELAASFDHNDFATVLTTGQHHPPRLAVTARHSAATEDIYAHDGWYWRTAEPIAPAAGPQQAAALIARRLGQPARGDAGPQMTRFRPRSAGQQEGASGPDRSAGPSAAQAPP